MANTRDIILGESFKGLFIGATGNRKTSSACSFHEAGPIWFADFDGKMDVAKEIYPTADIEYDTYGPHNYFGFLKKVREKVEQFGKKGTIVIDSFTMLTTSIINWQMDIKTGGDKPKVTKSGLIVPSWDEFNGEVSEVTKLLEMLKIAPCNVILTAHPVRKTKITEGGTGVVVESIASMGVKSPDMVPGYFKEIYYFKLESNIDANGPVNFFVQTQPTTECFARTNLGLPMKMKLSNERSLYQLIQENKKKIN